MALRKILTKRLNYDKYRNKNSSTSALLTSLDHESPAVIISPFVRISVPPPGTGFIRRFLQQRRTISQAATELFLSIPVGDRLREKLRSINVAGDRIRLDGLSPPAPESGELAGVTVEEARKVMRSVLMEKVRSRLRDVSANAITYVEYVRICAEGCGSREMGMEFAKTMDECGNVIVLGNVVFLRPEQVARSMEKVISQSIAIPNDPRRRELEQMENQKALIDQKAHKQVQTELYCGLGYIALQTLGFMRLTFWELSWDVMEPICYFVASFHFAIAYGFFLRTSKEPTFEGFFERRFRTKQRKLMEIHNFDVEKYNELCGAFYPNYNGRVFRSDFARAMHSCN